MGLGDLEEGNARASSSSAVTGEENHWERAVAHGKVYYFNRQSKQRQWEKPPPNGVYQQTNQALQDFARRTECAADAELDSQRLLRIHVEQLRKLQERFVINAHTYHVVERHWRKVSYYVALSLGILPVIAGATHLLPESASLWFGLAVSIVNVIVVVTNVKIDMGERVADASMARKGYGKVAQQLEFFICNASVSFQVSDVEKLLTVVQAVVDNIEANMTHPETLPSSGRSAAPTIAQVVPLHNVVSDAALRQSCTGDLILRREGNLSATGQASGTGPPPDAAFPPPPPSPLGFAAACASESTKLHGSLHDERSIKLDR